MLKRLYISNYALIDHLDIAFPDGLVIITGETGAGKSILLGALSLVLGGRSDVSVLKHNDRNCVVEAVFEDNGNERIFRRVVTPQGRSRGFIDDEPAGVEHLREEAARLIDIHSQHQQLLLSARDFQQHVLDSYAGITDEVAAHGREYRRYVEAEKALRELNERIAASERDRDYLEFQHRQLDEARLREGELSSLEEEQGRLAHGESVKEQLDHVERLFEDGEVSLEARLKEMANAIGRIAPLFPEFEGFSDRIDSARIELKDIREEIASRGGRIRFSPERLAEVEARLSVLYGLMRKFNVSAETELMALRDALAARLGAGVDELQEREQLQKEVETLRASCARSASALHAARQKAAPALSAFLQEQVRMLEMPRARFSVEVEQRPAFGADGSDEVTFLFDANDRGLKPLSKCASGGELSRIMLCIKSLLAQYQGMPTLIFDEIDSGVSGSVAEKMGRLIDRMGGRMQVFAITHLPQVASKGSAHYLVYKESDAGGVQTRIRLLDGEERLHEIARMLSGEGVTPEALANAGVLLQGKQSINN